MPSRFPAFAAALHCAADEPPIDPTRGRALMQNASRGEALTDEERAYLDRVKAEIRKRAMTKQGTPAPAPNSPSAPSTSAAKTFTANPEDWKTLRFAAVIKKNNRTFPTMKRTLRAVITPLFTLALAASSLRGDEPAQPNRAGTTGTAAAAPNGVGQQRRWPQQKAEWVDPIREAANGAQFKTFASKVLGHDVSYLVSLPPGYESGTARFPVIYWLHGMGGNQRGGATMFLPHVQAAMKAGTLPPCLVVLVNGMVKSFYCDSSDGKVPMESVIMKDLIPHVDATYRTLAQREGRIVEGYSMGGYGAAHLGFKFPDVFGTVVINAGALIDPSLTNLPKDGPMFGVFGEDNVRRVAEHPLTLAKQNADNLRGHTRIRIGCGSLDSLLPRNKELHELLTGLRIEHDYEIVEGVAHESPKYYGVLGAKVYDFHAKALAR